MCRFCLSGTPYSRHANCRAYLIISRPDFFEKSVIPYIMESEHSIVQDPIDASAKEIIQNLFCNSEIIFDYEMRPNRLPKVLMQTGTTTFFFRTTESGFKIACRLPRNIVVKYEFCLKK